MEIKEITISGGHIALVDADDFDRINSHKWHLNSRGYATCSIHGVTTRQKKLKMHHAIMKIEKGFECDHVNGNKLDNRKENLRQATRSQNMANQKKKTGTVSKYKGVCRSGKKWMAKIKVSQKDIYLGTFNSQTEAALAYNKAALKHFGEYARINNIRKDEF